MVLGQLLSLCLCGTGYASSELAQLHISFPTLQSTIAYLCLFIIFSIKRFYRGELSFSPRKKTSFLPSDAENDALSECATALISADIHSQSPTFTAASSIYVEQPTPPPSIWLHLLLAFLDVEANFLLILAYKYTSLLSVMLLDAWTIPCVLMVSILIYRKTYSIAQIVAVCVCTVGLAMLIWADVFSHRISRSSSSWIGDVLVIAGATLYSFSNTLQEHLVGHSQTRTLHLMSGFGLIICLIQVWVLEPSWIQIHWTPEVVYFATLFTVSLVFFYACAPVVLASGGACLLNVSLLTSDFYGAMLEWFILGTGANLLHILSFVIILGGGMAFHLMNP